jgi:hypothetical protein
VRRADAQKPIGRQTLCGTKDRRVKHHGASSERPVFPWHADSSAISRFQSSWVDWGVLRRLRNGRIAEDRISNSNSIQPKNQTSSDRFNDLIKASESLNNQSVVFSVERLSANRSWKKPSFKRLCVFFKNNPIWPWGITDTAYTLIHHWHGDAGSSHGYGNQLSSWLGIVPRLIWPFLRSRFSFGWQQPTIK